MVKPEKSDELGGVESGVSFWGRKQRVWYTARTHSQIAQTVAEVRRCDIEGLSVRVMGARDQLCVHPTVSSEKDNYIKVRTYLFENFKEATATNPRSYEQSVP